MALACLAVGSLPALAESVSIEDAQAQLHDKSGSLRAARFQREARQLEADATGSLSLPQINASVLYSRLKRTYEIDVSPITDPLNKAAGPLSASSGVKIPALPSSVEYDYRNEGIRPILGFNWALFTGGKITATQNLAAARTIEAGAEERHASEVLTTQLVRTYYGLQLAAHAVAVRNEVFTALALHLKQAERFEKSGVIARADRLHAQVAFDEAQRNLLKAQDDRALAQVALNRLLQSSGDIAPSSPLFVRSIPVEPLAAWTRDGLGAHPGLAILDAKRQQSAQMETIAKSTLLPEIFAFGTWDMNKNALTLVEPNWVVGVGMRIALVDHLDRSDLISAARRTSAGLAAYEEQARDDVSTLIEKRWRELEHARKHYLLLESSIKLAQENVRLRESSFREGLSTSLDLVDARLALARAEIDRTQSAHDYVVALAELLEASGQSERFAEYAARADIRIGLPIGPTGSNS